MSGETRVNSNIANIVQQGYECKVGMEALDRAGKNPNLKGVVHEVLFKDKLNAQNLLNGKTATLTQSTTAVRDDVLVKSAGKVVERFQLKDAPASVGKVIKQVSSGKYAGTKLVGTNETVKGYVASGGNTAKTMSSSGISTKTTGSIADKALGNSISKSGLASVAGKAGAFGAALGGGIEVVSSFKDWSEGSIDGAEYAGRVVKSSVKSAAVSSVGAAAATATSAVATTAISTVSGGTFIASTSLGAAALVSAPIVISTGVAILAGIVISSVFDSIFD